MVPAGAPVAEKLTHENAEASISQGVIVSIRFTRMIYETNTFNFVTRPLRMRPFT